jgi:hypothetical protein
MKVRNSLLLIALAVATGGCADEDAQLCKLKHLYQARGPAAAAEAIEASIDGHNFGGAMLLSQYLMLRGNKVSDFDRAYSLLNAMEMPRTRLPLTGEYVSFFKFIALQNGSRKQGVDPVSALECGNIKDKKACASAIATDVLNNEYWNEGLGSKQVRDLQALYSASHLAAFGTRFELPFDNLNSTVGITTSPCVSRGEDPYTSRVPVE